MRDRDMNKLHLHTQGIKTKNANPLRLHLHDSGQNKQSN